MGFRVRAFAAAWLLGVALLAGCSAADSPGRARASAPSSAPAVAAVVPVARTPDELLSRLEASTAKAGSFSMKIDGAPLRGSGRVAVGDSPAASIVLTDGSQSTQLLLADGVMYAKDGADSSGHWKVLPQDDADKLMDSLTPAGTFKALRAGAKSLEGKGVEELQGVKATRYDVVVDTAKAVAVAGVTAPPGTPDLIYSIWVDADDHMRRITTDVGDAALVVDYSAWGQPVQIVAPPADLVDRTP